jgi:hypothetical protein
MKLLKLYEDENFSSFEKFKTIFFVKKKILKEIIKKKKKYNKKDKKFKKDIINEAKNIIGVNQKDYLKSKQIPSSTFHYWLNTVDEEKNKQSKMIDYDQEIIIIGSFRFLVENNVFLNNLQQEFLFYLITNSFFTQIIYLIIFI